MRVLILLIVAAAFVSAERSGAMYEEADPPMEAPEEDLLSVVKELRQHTDGTRFEVHGARIERESSLIQKARAYKHSFGARNALRAAIRALVSELTSGHNHDRNALNNERNAGHNAMNAAKNRGKNVTRRYREKACPTKKAQVEAEAARNTAKGHMNAIKRRKICGLSTSWFDMNIKGAAPKFGGALRNKWDKARAEYVRKLAKYNAAVRAYNAAARQHAGAMSAFRATVKAEASNAAAACRNAHKAYELLKRDVASNVRTRKQVYIASKVITCYIDNLANNGGAKGCADRARRTNTSRWNIKAAKMAACASHAALQGQMGPLSWRPSKRNCHANHWNERGIKGKHERNGKERSSKERNSKERNSKKERNNKERNNKERNNKERSNKSKEKKSKSSNGLYRSPSHGNWFKFKGTKNTNCKVACRKVGRYCNKHEIKRVTLESSCSTLKKIFGNRTCRRCSPSDSTNTYCFPGMVANGFYHHTSFNSHRGFNCNTTPDPRVQGACPCSPRPNPQPKPVGNWYKGSRHAGTCNAMCAAMGKKCSNAMIKSATLNSSCSAMKKVFGNKVCRRCSPSDSTNTYCFPGMVANGFYYHTSFNSHRGFTCNTRPDNRVTPMCPCTGVGAHKWIASSTTNNPDCNTFCSRRGKRCDSAAIKAATLQNNCSTLKGIFGNKVCRRCSPSDSTNTYCFPGMVANGFYYHSTFSSRGFTCSTRPDPRVRTACPCK